MKRALLVLGLPVLCLLGLTASAAPGLQVIDTAHYLVHAEATRAQTEEMGRVLEAAWPQLAKFFGAEPELADGVKLNVFFGATQQSFFARLKADGITPPKAGGYYSPKTRVAYLWRQPTIYNTRCLLIHEATHQFHFLSKTRNRSVPMTWYVEGLAEYLGRHYWDGESLRLGELPLLSLSDYSRKALESLNGEEVSLAKVIEGKGGGRPLFFAIVRYLLTGENGKYRKSFARLSKKLDRGAASPALFSRTVGSPRKLEQKFREWLRHEQEPWRQIFNEWEGMGSGRFSGTAGGSIVSTCAVKAPVKRLSATIEVPADGAWIAGVLLHHTDNGDYTTALSYGGKEIRVARRQDHKWVTLGRFPGPKPKEKGLLRFVVERTGGKVRLLVEGKEMGTFELPGGTFGLALQGSTVRYRNVTWE